MSKDLVVMDNVITRAAYNLSVNEQRLILSAISQIPKSEPVDANRAYQVTRDDFIRMGVNPDTVARDIRMATKDLMKKTLIVKTDIGELEFNWLKEVLRYDKQAEEKLKAQYPNPEDYSKYIRALRGYNLLDSLPMRNDDDNIVARIVFNERIVPFLSDLKVNFTKFLLDEVAGFGSIYSFRIYELMMQFKSTSYCKMSIKDLRYMINLGNKYEATKDLRKWVIDTAVDEINEKSPYIVSYEMLKTGRKFTHLELKFKTKSTYKKEQALDSNTIDWLSGQAKNEAQKAPSWQAKGLSDGQIKKIGCNVREFVDANSSKMSASERRGYQAVFESWKGLLKDPKTVGTFNMVQELLDRQK